MLALVLAFIGNFTFDRFHHADAAPISGVMINFVMSLLFIFLLFQRPGLRGISWSAALFRVAGNTVIFFANVFLMQNDRQGLRDFALFLFAGTAIFDFTFLQAAQQSASRSSSLGRRLILRAGSPDRAGSRSRVPRPAAGPAPPPSPPSNL